MGQIGNVFYNLLNMVGTQNNDSRMIGLSNDLRHMVQSKKFDNLFENNVPYAGFDKINLLKTYEIPDQDRDKLIRDGFGDLLHHPSV